MPMDGISKGRCNESPFTRARKILRNHGNDAHEDVLLQIEAFARIDLEEEKFPRTVRLVTCDKVAASGISERGNREEE